MYPAPFAYVAARSFVEARDALQRHGPDAKLLAGGCSLIPLLRLRLAEPGVIVDLTTVEGGSYVTERADGIRIGAMTREVDIETASALRTAWPILPDASALIADPLVRNMGTIGGNAAHADPANDHPAVLLAIGAEFVILGSAGERVVSAAHFFVDLYGTALEPDEVLVEIRLPAGRTGVGSAYEKFERQVGDFPVAAVAAVLEVAHGRVIHAALGLTNVAPTPVLATAAATALVGGAPDEARISAAAALAADGLEPWNELRGSADYKRDLVRVLAGRAIRRALARAEAAT